MSNWWWSTGTSCSERFGVHFSGDIQNPSRCFPMQPTLGSLLYHWDLTRWFTEVPSIPYDSLILWTISKDGRLPPEYSGALGEIRLWKLGELPTTNRPKPFKSRAKICSSFGVLYTMSAASRLPKIFSTNPAAPAAITAGCTKTIGSHPFLIYSLVHVPLDNLAARYGQFPHWLPYLEMVSRPLT